MRTPFWPHQYDAAQFALARKKAVINHAMGIGKSLTALAVHEQIRPALTLILCPLSVARVWPCQIETHMEHPPLVIDMSEGPVPKRIERVKAKLGAAVARKEQAIIVANYRCAINEKWKAWATHQPWDMLILDEIHAEGMKGAGNQTSMFVARLADHIPYRLGLTGTLIPHSPMDLYGIMRAIDRRIFGSSAANFRARYAVMSSEVDVLVDYDENVCALTVQAHFSRAEELKLISGGRYVKNRDRWVFPGTAAIALKLAELAGAQLSPSAKELLGPKIALAKPKAKAGTSIDTIVGWRNQDEMSAKIRQVAHIVKRSEVFDDIPPTFSRLECDLEPDVRKVYDKLDEEFFARVKRGEVTIANALVELLRLQQLAGGALHLDSGEIVEASQAKEKLLEEILDGLEEPVAVFCRFHHDIDVVHRVAERLGRVSGEVSGRRKDLAAGGKFPEGVDILAVQIQSGGLGVDLTRARVALFYSLGFSLGEYLQAVARVTNRGDQTQRHAHVLALVARDTVDEKVWRALEKREQVVQSIING